MIKNNENQKLTSIFIFLILNENWMDKWHTDRSRINANISHQKKRRKHSYSFTLHVWFFQWKIDHPFSVTVNCIRVIWTKITFQAIVRISDKHSALFPVKVIQTFFFFETSNDSTELCFKQ